MKYNILRELCIQFSCFSVKVITEIHLRLKNINVACNFIQYQICSYIQADEFCLILKL